MTAASAQRVERPHLAQDAGRLRAEALGAGFFAREPRAFEHAHRNAGAREPERRAGARGPAAHHEHLAHRRVATRAPTSAPPMVLTAFTPSLSSQRKPPRM